MTKQILSTKSPKPTSEQAALAWARFFYQRYLEHKRDLQAQAGAGNNDGGYKHDKVEGIDGSP